MVDIGTGAILDDLCNFCEAHKLEIPFYLPEDREKPLWKIINENSLTLSNLKRNIQFTESFLDNGQIITSSSMDSYAEDLFDIKNILLEENQNVSHIHSLRIKFRPVNYWVVNIIQLQDNKYQFLSDFLSQLTAFTKTWKEDVLYDVAYFKQNGIFKHELKFSSPSKAKVSNSQQIDFIKSQLDEFNLATEHIATGKEFHADVVGQCTPANTHSEQIDKEVSMYFTGHRESLVETAYLLKRELEKENGYSREVQLVTDQLNNRIQLRAGPRSLIDEHSFLKIMARAGSHNLFLIGSTGRPTNN